MAIRKVLYTAKTHTTGGRDHGASRSSDGRLDVKFNAPESLGVGTNPEQLFAAGWSACFLAAMGIVARRMKIAIPSDAAIDAEVDLGSDESGYSLSARLNISLPGLERSLASELAEATYRTCPYSKATRGNIEVEINVLDLTANTAVGTRIATA